MKCQICKNEFEENKIEEHHIHPRFMDNKNGSGKKCNLCKKCHDILHLQIPTIIWRFIPVDKRQDVIDAVVKYTERKFG